jgi:hypothetical protein
MSLRRVLAFTLVASLVASVLPSPTWAGEVQGGTRPAVAATTRQATHGLRASVEQAVANVSQSRQPAIGSPGPAAPPVRAQMGPGGNGGGGGGGWIIWTVLALAASAAATYYITKQVKKQTTTPTTSNP